jgi:uncharacterized protein (TIGR02300 family)
MPDLGKKYECFNCRTKFYDLNKSAAVCPKCGADQKDAKAGEEASAPAPRPRRLAPIVVVPEEVGEFGEEGGHEEEEETIDHAGFGEEEDFSDEEAPLDARERDHEEEF